MAETPLPAEHTSSLKIYFRLLSYVKPYAGIFLPVSYTHLTLPTID